MMKRIVIILLVVFIVISHVCLAEPFFPSTNELFGQTMPSISSINGRDADAEEMVDEGTVYTYQDFSAHEYTAFSKYLAEQDCTVEQTSVDNKVLTTQISKGNGTVLFQYDYPAKVATMLYPNNTRKEEETGSLFLANSDVEVLPDAISTFGTSFPSMDLICNREPTILVLDTYETKYSYSDVTETEYNRFCCYLTEMNCSLVDSDIKGMIFTATVRHDDSSFQLKYDNNAYTVDIIYPELFYIEDLEYTDSSSAVALLPIPPDRFSFSIPLCVHRQLVSCLVVV